MKVYSFLLSVILLASCAHTPTIHMIGDSTMANKPEEVMPEKGWGQLLPEFFSDDIIVKNYAKNGSSTRSFIYDGLWDSVYANLQKGDYVIIQFGHNDDVITKTKRYTIPKEFKYNITRFVKDARKKGAKPVLCTPIQRRHFDSTGVLMDTHGVYPDKIREVAKELKVAFVDLQEKSDSLINGLGDEESKKLFMHVKPGIYPKYPNGKIDNTHFVELGARTMAGLFVSGLREAHHPLCSYLKKN
jgi:DNA sulfur modification protein DndE